MKKTLVIVIVILVLLLAIGITIAVIVDNANKQTEIDIPSNDSLENLFVEQPAVILPDPTVIVNSVQKMARVETYVATYQRIYTYAVDQEYLFGACGKKMVFVASGQAVAGIDFSQFQEGDIEVVDVDTVRIKMPQSQIFNVFLNENESQVVSIQYGIFAAIDNQLETAVRQYAQNDLVTIANNSDILTIAQLNGEDFIRDFLLKLAFSNVEFVTDPT